MQPTLRKISFVILAFLLSLATAVTSAHASGRPTPEQACVLPVNGTERPDPTWPLLDQSVPACHRVIVSVKPGARLELDRPLLARNHPTGIIEIRARVIDAIGIYDETEQPRRLAKGVTLWTSLNLCDARAARFLDDEGRVVENIKDARTLVTGSELVAIAHSDELPDSAHFCSY